ncbi:MAG TPA: type II toxin-antitoxin system VapC family toxin, partial [Tepidiformaceae bacterium]|nr:type II toxin-antitoxin system VapC family toxin [Tepidiformaceae bacterium]
SEFLNVLAGYMRTQGLSAADASRALNEAWLLVEAEPAPNATEVLDLVTQSRCSAYDLEFVALAIGLGVPLVTNDRQVLEAFPGVAISPEAFAP